MDALRVDLRRLLEPRFGAVRDDRDIELLVIYLIRVEAWMADHAADMGWKAKLFRNENLIAMCQARRVNFFDLPRYRDVADPSP